MITFSDRKDIDPNVLAKFYAFAPWSQNRNVADIQHMLQETDVMISAWDESQLVGFGRVLTDFVYRASIWDVIVHPDHQGQDIGTQIMDNIVLHPLLQRVELFWLCTMDKQSFYEKMGFSSKKQTGMVWDRKEFSRRKS